MAVRPYWKGYLKLSLVSCAVALYSATTSGERVRFNMLNRDTGNRLKQQYVDAQTGELVDADQKVRGYEVAKNDYVVVEAEELEAVQLESTHTLAVDVFVDRDSVDEVYLDTAYYLAPNDQVAVEAFSVIRDAMHDAGKAGLARVVLHNRERIVMLEPRGAGLLATTLHYAYEVKSDKGVFEDIPKAKADKETVALAKHIIQSKAGKFDPSSFNDRYETALVDMLKAKHAGRAPKMPAQEARPTNVVNLMDALKRSLAAEGKAENAPVRKGGKATGKTTPAKPAKGRAAASASSAGPAKRSRPLKKASG